MKVAKIIHILQKSELLKINNVGGEYRIYPAKERIVKDKQYRWRISDLFRKDRIVKDKQYRW